MNKITAFFFSCVLASAPLMAQEGVTQCGTPTGQPPFPLQSYHELPDPKPASMQEWAAVKSPQVRWGSTDVRYAKHAVPVLPSQQSITLEGWRGEKLNAQAVVCTPTDLNELTYAFSDFKSSSGEVLPASAFSGGFVRYVMTDELNKDGRGACGERPDHTLYDSLLVADAIDHLAASMPVKAKSVQPVWINCRIPASLSPGTYKGTVEVKDGGCLLGSLTMYVKVSSRTLPEPSAWKYHLDLWQNPFAVARYHQLPLWSREHMEAMRPLMKMLVDAGQKVITASIMHHPWNAQTEDAFESMVTWTKRIDGTWAFDFAVFDLWVEMMMSVGIDKQINCYSMVPWKLSFQYFDQATNRLQVVNTAPGKPDYEEMWLAMLRAFSKHLREKGWFDICTIAMDERPMDVMLKTLEVIRKADPDFKVSLAGNFHNELEADIYDYCIPMSASYPEDVLKRRTEKKWPTTYYTSCAEAFPNTFTFSDPAEAVWMSFYSAKFHLDGYLRWAYNSWVKEPLLDSRFRTWAAGDTYLVYPGSRSSIRFERLVEGIQAHEKITLLREEFVEKNNKAGMKRLERILSAFRLEDFPQVPAAVTVRKANRLLNAL